MFTLDKTREKFNNLSIKDRGLLVIKFGELVLVTHLTSFKICVYEINSNFVEVWYNWKLKEIQRIRIPNYEEMDLHLKSIKLKI